MNSLNLSFGQELKSSYSNKSFLLLSNMFRKNEKKNCQKRSNCLSLTRKRTSSWFISSRVQNQASRVQSPTLSSRAQEFWYALVNQSIQNYSVPQGLYYKNKLDWIFITSFDGFKSHSHKCLFQGLQLFCCCFCCLWICFLFGILQLRNLVTKLSYTKWRQTSSY